MLSSPGVLVGWVGACSWWAGRRSPTWESSCEPSIWPEDFRVCSTVLETCGVTIIDLVAIDSQSGIDGG